MSDILNKKQKGFWEAQVGTTHNIRVCIQGFYLSCFKGGNKKITEYLIIKELIFNHKTDYGI
jgi:hypothetical protein